MRTHENERHAGLVVLPASAARLADFVHIIWKFDRCFAQCPARASICEEVHAEHEHSGTPLPLTIYK